MAKFILSHYSGQDTLLAERMAFLDTCKQRLHESVGEFEARCKCHGLQCEYHYMANPEEEPVNLSGTSFSHVDLALHPFTYFTCGEAIAEVGHLELIFTYCPYSSFLRKNS